MCTKIIHSVLYLALVTMTFTLVRKSFHHIIAVLQLLQPLYNADGVPPDGTPINITNTFKVEVVAIFYSSAIAGIMFAIVCLLFNVIFRSKR